MSGSRAVRWRTVLTLAVMMARAAGAQPKGSPDILIRQPIAFDFTEPGRASVVRPRDAARAGQWELRGTPGALVRLEFTLPAQMISPDGPAIAITFGPEDAAIGVVPSAAAALPMDPRAARTMPLGAADGRLFVFIGGTASPSLGARPSRYDAAILLTATYVLP